MEAQVVRAALHVGRLDRGAEGERQRRQVLVEDLILQVAGAGRDQHAAPGEDGRQEVGEGLARAGAGFGDQGAAAFEGLGDALGQAALSGPGFEALDGTGERAVVRERALDAISQRHVVNRSG